MYKCMTSGGLFTHNGIVMSFHHRVTQSFTEFYSFDFKLIKFHVKLCVYSSGELIITRKEMNQLITDCLNEMPYICVHKEKKVRK